MLKLKGLGGHTRGALGSPRKERKPHLEQLRVGMIGEWSHISAVGFSVDCFNIVEFYVRLRLRKNLLEGRISFLTRS